MSKVAKRHPYHIVTPSPWPLTTSIGALALTIGAVLYMHGYTGGLLTLIAGLLYILGSVYYWWRDVIIEATLQGKHTRKVQKGLKLGFALFIVSEIMFFFAFFWAFFHSSLAPAIEIGSIWPPFGIKSFYPWGIPLLNTAILLTSGFTITYAHHAILLGWKREAYQGLLLTILLAVVFTAVQAYEYLNAPFSINDGIYGSTFYMATGFHGLHVMIGTTFIYVCLRRLHQFTTTHHVGFEASAWYWHFVDVVWLFLWVSIYWWGSL